MDFTAVTLNNGPDNGQTQTGTTALTGAGFVHPEEPFKQMGDRLLRDAHTGIGYYQVGIFLVPV